ncbi:MAG: DEAD/DEAH box helicase [Candidatus Liptonbacteria bacterium]|nr:DEAD/DEAH box helicase [Candidatus Niyogibacteria bacterium]MBI4087400.1 DEAD/DEAH box helicase [Candidatus Liptonbacteria bacterium]
MADNTTHESEHQGFYGLGIAPALMDILARHQFTEPTPIQRQAIPAAIEGKDVVGVAQTGTGKTLAFGIPMIQILAQSKGRGLVLLPTRELAMQVDEQLNKIGRGLGLKTAMLIGGQSMKPQMSALSRDPHIIIATPGRLLDHLGQGTVKLNRTSTLILDEADRMLDMGFQPQIKKILQVLPQSRQTMLFSATLPKEIMAIASQYMRLPIRIEVAPPGTTVESVTQEIFVVKKEDKSWLLKKILVENKGSALVFTRTKYGAKKVTHSVAMMGHSAAEIHGNRSQGQRQEALEGFKSGKYRVLVATDIASRGIDVKGIELVINYDLPEQADDYVHRIGRTARAGRSGKAISFVMPDQKKELADIESLIKMRLPIMRLPDMPRATPPMGGPASSRLGRPSAGGPPKPPPPPFNRLRGTGRHFRPRR